MCQLILTKSCHTSCKSKDSPDAKNIFRKRNTKKPPNPGKLWENRMEQKPFFRNNQKGRRFFPWKDKGIIPEKRPETTWSNAALPWNWLVSSNMFSRTCFSASLLRQLPDPRHQSYITYPAPVLLMTRILSSLCYISSMRKTSEEFNSEQMIANIWTLCGEADAGNELPYWETMNRYLKRLKPACLQKVQTQWVRHLLRSRAFEAARVRGRYWQILIDGTQLYRSRNSLDERSLYCIHNKGTANEYRENYYYVLEAKLVLHSVMIVSLLSEFVENEEGGEAEKQDCERKACWRLMERLKEEFPRLPICLSADSLYACKGWFQRCEQSCLLYTSRCV